MKLDKKQAPQLVVLGVLVLACIGYVSFTVFKPPAVEIKPPAPKQEEKSGAAGAVVRLAAQPIQSTAAFPDLSTPLAKRDPFTMQNLPESESAAAKQANPTPAPRAVPPIDIAMSKVPPLIPPIGTISENLSVLPSMGNQDPDFLLTGVIRGRYGNVAIIRVNDSERHVVKQGQFINGRYQVLDRHVRRRGVGL